MDARARARDGPDRSKRKYATANAQLNAGIRRPITSTVVAQALATHAVDGGRSERSVGSRVAGRERVLRRRRTARRSSLDAGGRNARLNATLERRPSPVTAHATHA